MRPQRIILGLLCLAAGLVATIAYVARPGAKLPPIPVETTAPVASEQPETLPPAATVSLAGNANQNPAFTWRQVESDDYQRYIANLRALGCPEQTIQDIIIADVNKLYAARENPLKTAPKSTPDNKVAESPEQKLDRLRQLRIVQQEKRSVIKELLGIDFPLDLLPSSSTRDYHAFEVALGFVPADKRDAVQLLQETYWQQTDALKAKYGTKQTPESLAESRQLDRSLHQELTKLLSPQELEDYDMRTSANAKQLSSKLAAYFHPTESEFRQIFKAQRGYDEAIAELAKPQAPVAQPASPAEKQALAQQRAADRQALDQARSTLRDQLNEQLKSSLGEGRYTEYQRSQDKNYDLLARLGVRYNLPQDTVLQAYDLQQSFKAPSGPVTDPAAQQAQQAALQNQLNEKLTAILGEQAARGYRRVKGGSVPLP